MSKTRLTSVRRCGALTIAALLAVPVSSDAQSNGTWAVDVGLAGGNWSDPNNWVGGVVAGEGGIATFMELPFSSQPLQIYQDLPTVELSGINFTGPFDYLLRPAPATTNSLTLTGPAVIHTALPPLRATEGYRIHLPMLGSSGLTKTGPGLLTLRAANTFTGAVNILGGTLNAAEHADAAFGDAGNAINLNDATLRVGSTWATARTINLLGDGTLGSSAFGSASFTLNGPITGAGGLNLIDSDRFHLTGHNTYAGPTSILGPWVALRGDGAIGNTSSLLIRGTLELDNGVTNHTDRVRDSAAVTFHDGQFFLSGNNSANSSEHLGTTTVARGTTTIHVRPRVTMTTTLAMESLSRANGAVVFFAGEKLGAAPGNSVSNVLLQQPPPLVGGGGSAGQTNISIIPWAFGNSAAFVTEPHLPTSGLVTYGPTGVRPLNLNTAYASTIAAAGATDNVRLVSSEQLATPATINALVLASGLKLEGPGTLTISSGLLLSVGTGTSGKTVRAPLNFGDAEAIILTLSQSSQSPPLIMLSGPISGSGGLTKQGNGTAIFNAANTYTGPTRIGGGAAVFVSDVPASGPGPFGSDTSPIVFAGRGRLLYAGAGTGSLNRDLLVRDPAEPDDPSDFASLAAAAGSNLTVNGNISLETSLAIAAGSLSTVTLAGTISGDGMLGSVGVGRGTIIVTGDNTFTGGVRMGQAVWALGSDTALGTGIIPGGRIRAHGGPRTIANDMIGAPNIVGDQPITFTGSMDLAGVSNHGIENSALTTYAGTLHSGGLDKYGPGTLVLSGDNVYTGPTNVIEGALRVAHADALGTADSPTTVRQGASLEITGGTQSNEAIIATGAGFLGQGAIRSIGGHNSFGDLAAGATGQIVVNVVEDSLTVGNVALPLPADLRKDGPGRLAARRYRGGVVQVSEGILAVTPGRSDDKTSVLLVLNIAPQAAKFDLGDNDLVWDYFSISQLTPARSQIGTAYADGAWTGPGITSSLADNSNFALGYAESSEIFTEFPAEFSGVLVDDTAVLVRFTRYGDADLDGIVNSRTSTASPPTSDQPTRCGHRVISTTTGSSTWQTSTSWPPASVCKPVPADPQPKTGRT